MSWLALRPPKVEVGDAVGELVGEVTVTACAETVVRPTTRLTTWPSPGISSVVAPVAAASVRADSSRGCDQRTTVFVTLVASPIPTTL